MSNLLELVNRFERLKGVFKYDYKASGASVYLSDLALAQIEIVDAVLHNNYIHRYRKEGLQLFLLRLKAEDYANASTISDRSYFIQAFNGYVQLLKKEIAFNRIAGVRVSFVF